MIIGPCAIDGEDSHLRVVIGHNSHGVSTQSVRARVDNANWKGAQAFSTSDMNCLANVLATSL